MSNEKLLTSLNDADGAVIPAAATRFVRLTALSTLLAVCLLALTLLGLEVIKELEKLKSITATMHNGIFPKSRLIFTNLGTNSTMQQIAINQI